jgi:hypothetical protein
MNLGQIGNELYGSCWQVRLARDLNISDRTVRRWVAGKSPVPSWVWYRLRELLRKQSFFLRNMAEGMDLK